MKFKEGMKVIAKKGFTRNGETYFKAGDVGVIKFSKGLNSYYEILGCYFYPDNNSLGEWFTPVQNDPFEDPEYAKLWE